MKYVILKLVQWAFLALKKVHKCLLKFLVFRKYFDRGRKSESYRSSPRSWNSRQEKTFPSLINYESKFDVSGCSLTSLSKFCEWPRKKVGVLQKQSKLKQQAREDLGRKSESYGCSPSWNSRQEKTFPSLINYNYETKFDASGCSLTSLREYFEQGRKLESYGGSPSSSVVNFWQQQEETRVNTLEARTSSYSPSRGHKWTNLDLQLLRQEMVSLRQMDMDLLCMFWSLNEKMQEYKAQTSRNSSLSPPRLAGAGRGG